MGSQRTFMELLSEVPPRDDRAAARAANAASLDACMKNRVGSAGHIFIYFNQGPRYIRGCPVKTAATAMPCPPFFRLTWHNLGGAR